MAEGLPPDPGDRPLVPNERRFTQRARRRLTGRGELVLAVRPVCSLVQQRRAQREQGVAGKGKRQAGYCVRERHESHEDVEGAGK